MNKLSMIVVSLFVASAALSLVESELILSEYEKSSICADRSGIRPITDISSTHLTENGCRLACIVYGHHRQYFLHEGRECHNPGDWKCLRGQCLNKAERSEKPQPSSKLHDVTIQIKSAYVQDEDKFSVNGESDVFVLVKVYNTSGIYEDATVIGNTPTIQDTNRPVWDNFVLKPNPLPLTARIKFILFDSDKPVKPDYLGSYEATVEDLMDANWGERQDYLTLNGKVNKPYHIVTAVTAKEVSIPSDF